MHERREPLVSILILHYQGVDMLRNCLASLVSVVSAQVEVVLVDNDSPDDLIPVIAEFNWVTCVRSDHNAGFAGGNNLGLNHCRGKYVLLLNDDTVCNTTFVKSLSAYLDEHPAVGIVQGKMILPRFGNTLDVCGSFLTSLGFPYHYGYFKSDGPKYQRSYPVFSGKGACLMFRREIIPKVGGFLFDEDFFCYYEETDFCHRAWVAGYETHFVPSEPIQHLMGATSGRHPQRGFTLRRYLSNMVFSLSANLSFGSRIRILPLFWAIFISSLLFSILTFRWIQAEAHWAALKSYSLNLRKIRERRKLIKLIRKKTDRDIFVKALRNPGLSYFVRTFSGAISDYVDQELV